MGRAAAAEVTHALVEAGMAADTPVLVAINVSLPTERVARGHLSAMPFLVKAISDDDPTLLLIGEAVEAGSIHRVNSEIGSAPSCQQRGDLRSPILAQGTLVSPMPGVRD
jgi:uroporphyrin-III C-methyltransferase